MSKVPKVLQHHTYLMMIYFLSSSRQLVWSYNLNSQSEILELLQKLKASDYRFDNQPTCCYCFEIKNSDAHFKHSGKRYWKIFNTKVMKIFHCFILLSVAMLQQLKKILSNIAETATDLTVNSWVAMFISQVTSIKSQHRVSAVREKKTMIRLVLKQKRVKIQVDIDKLPRGENAEMNIQRLNVRIDQVMYQIKIPSYRHIHKYMLFC